MIDQIECHPVRAFFKGAESEREIEMSTEIEPAETGAHINAEDFDRVIDENPSLTEIPSLNCNVEDCHLATNEFDTSPHDTEGK